MVQANAWRGKIESVKVLIAAGAKVNIKTEDGETALAHAMRENHMEIVKLLKDAGARG